MKNTIGVDIGATNLRVGIGNRKGELFKKFKEKTVNTGDQKDLFQQIEKLIGKLDTGSFERIVVGAAGRIKGKRVEITNLKYEEIDFTLLEERFDVGVEVYNDTSIAALGEKKFGAAKDYENFVYLTLSTGIGTGVYIDGELLQGKAGNAGEVGHSVINYDSEFLTWEESVSGKNLPRFLKKRYGEELSCKEFFEEVGKGRMREAFEEVTKINAIGMGNLVNAYNPSLVVLGGGLILKRKGGKLFKKIKEKLPQFCFNEVPELKVTPLGDYIVLYGALAAGSKRV